MASKKVTCPQCDHIYRTNGKEEYSCPECGYSEDNVFIIELVPEGEK